jgi:hypothetical protein
MISQVLNSYALTLKYLRRLIDDVPDDALTAQPAGVVNHPLWTIGHLVYSAQMIGGEIGLAPWLADDWRARYGTGSVPVAERRQYPASDSLLYEMANAELQLKEKLNSLGEEAMQQPLPDVKYRDIFPSLGHAVTHVLAAHTAAHVGQVIAWRKAMGFRPLSVQFD